MALTEQREKELRTWCASASDDTLQDALKNGSSFYTPDEITIITEIWNSRLEEIQKIQQEIRIRYDSESDEILLNMLKNSSFYPLNTIRAISTLWESRGYKLPDDFNSTQSNGVVITDFRMSFGSVFIICIKFSIALFIINIILGIIGFIIFKVILQGLFHAILNALM